MCLKMNLWIPEISCVIYERVITSSYNTFVGDINRTLKLMVLRSRL